MYKMAIEFIKRDSLEREINRQMGIRPSRNPPSGVAIGAISSSLMDSSPTSGKITLIC